MRDKSRPIEAICDACDLRHTKPGAAPEHLSSLISDVLRLDVLREAGATFAYPDALTRLQWMGLEALTLARRRAQENEEAERRKERAQQSEVARLQSRLDRG